MSHKYESVTTGNGYWVDNNGTRTQVIDQDGTLHGSVVIDNSSITLAKLATGITPSHVIKFARLGAGITTTALSGLVVGDLVIRITTGGACTCKPVATTDTLPDDPGDTDYLIVLRAAA